MRGALFSSSSSASPSTLCKGRCPSSPSLPPLSPCPVFPSHLKFGAPRCPQKGARMQCRSGSSITPGPGSGENDSKAILDAFFLGKAFAEAVNERIESTVGEILSVVGQWQAEQQKQVIDFQEEVLQRAKKAKEKAALEAVGEQGAIFKSVMTSSERTAPAVPPPSPESTKDDPLQEMLKD